jgi:DNA-binding response OmpR family regulator
MQAWKAIVVEDDSDSMDLVQSLLEYQGIQVLPARTAQAALDILRDVTPTLFIIDLSLPGMDGWGLLKELQARRDLARVPRVAITAYHSQETASKAIEAGFDAYFPKPLDATTFGREIEGIVNSYG